MMMTTLSDKALRRYSRIAGLTYLLVILVGILKVNFIEPAVMGTGDGSPAANILAHELLFRTGIACEMIMYLLVIILSLSLYQLLKAVDKALAFSALLFRFGEALTGSILVILSGLIPLLLLNSGSAAANLRTDALLETFLNIRILGLNVVLIFVGVGGTLFCYLFYRSSFVPRILALWGIITYVSMFLLGFLNILAPDRPAMIETMLFGSGALFEVVFGVWLLIKGVNTN